MPCGGIYPIGGSWVEGYAAQQAQTGEADCFYCRKTEPPVTHFCDEWDCYLHAHCIDEFLATPEGQIVILHGHEVIR